MLPNLRPRENEESEFYFTLLGGAIVITATIIAAIEVIKLPFKILDWIVNG